MTHTRTAWNRLATLVAAAALAAPLAVGVPVQPAAAQEEGDTGSAQGVEMEGEGWFFRYRNPTRPLPTSEADPTGMVGPVEGTARGETNLYAQQPFGTGETLHVGVNAGQPEARLFLGLPTVGLTDEGEAVITGGEITLQDAGEQFGYVTGRFEQHIEGLEQPLEGHYLLVLEHDGDEWRILEHTSVLTLESQERLRAFLEDAEEA
jgi:hypothetical protein